MVLFFKQKTAYEMRISDWRSDVCSSDLRRALGAVIAVVKVADARGGGGADHLFGADGDAVCDRHPPHLEVELVDEAAQLVSVARAPFGKDRSEEHTSELQSLMRISYAVFCLKKKTQSRTHN